MKTKKGSNPTLSDIAKSMREYPKPCPLCACFARDLGHGISCDGCGLWLGNGTQVSRLGGYMKVWNGRVQSSTIKALELLGLNGDTIFERIREDLNRGLTKEARSHLNFVDVITSK